MMEREVVVPLDIMVEVEEVILEDQLAQIQLAVLVPGLQVPHQQLLEELAETDALNVTINLEPVLEAPLLWGRQLP